MSKSEQDLDATVASAEHSASIARFVTMLAKEKVVVRAGVDASKNDEHLHATLPKVIRIIGGNCSGDDLQDLYEYFGYSRLSVREALTSCMGRTLSLNKRFEWNVIS